MGFQIKLKVTGYVNVYVEEDNQDDAMETALSLLSDEFIDDITDIELDVEEMTEDGAVEC